MKKNLKSFLKGEFIGKKIEITKSRNPSLIGLKGKVIDETKNMLTIKTGNRQIKIIKNEVVIKLDKTEIQGKNIQKRPEERIKSK